MSIDLPPSSKVAMEFIKRYIAEYGWAPNYREIMDATGISSTSMVSFALQALANAHLIRHLKGQSRAIAITEHGETWLARR